MANLLPPVGTTRLLELVSPYVPDDFILNLCPRLSTGGRRCALSAPQLWRLHLLVLLTSTHSLNLVVTQLPEQAAWRRFCRLRRHWPGVRMLHEFRQQVGVSGLRRINQHLLERLLRRQGLQPHAVALMDATDLPAACNGFKKKHWGLYRRARGVRRPHAQNWPEPLVRGLQEAHTAFMAAHGASLGDAGAAGQLAGTGQRGRGRIAAAQPALVCATSGLVAGVARGRYGLSGGRKQAGRSRTMGDGSGDQTACRHETLAALRLCRAGRMSARGAIGMVGARTTNGATMVSRGQRRRSLCPVLASRRLSATLRVFSRSARNFVWFAAAGQPTSPAPVATSPSVDRTGAVLREKPTGAGTDVLQQPAADVANEFVGRQRGAVAHDGVVGPADGDALAGVIDAAPDGTGFRRRKVVLRRKTRFSSINCKMTKLLSEHPLILRCKFDQFHCASKQM